MRERCSDDGRAAGTRTPSSSAGEHPATLRSSAEADGNRRRRPLVLDQRRLHKPVRRHLRTVCAASSQVPPPSHPLLSPSREPLLPLGRTTHTSIPPPHQGPPAAYRPTCFCCPSLSPSSSVTTATRPALVDPLTPKTATFPLRGPKYSHAEHDAHWHVPAGGDVLQRSSRRCVHDQQRRSGGEPP